MLKPKKFLPFKIIKNIDTNYGCCKYINFKFYIFGLPIFHNFIKIHKI